MTIYKSAAFASFLLAVCFVIAPLIYLTGNLRDSLGVYAYNLADFLYGPVTAACLISLVYALRERIGKSALRRMDLALLAALLAGLGMAAVAFIRASNRQYHLNYPDLDLENSITILTAWTTFVTGMNATGFHFFGWVFVLLGAAGWTTRLFPRLLSALMIFAGLSALFVYLFPELEGLALSLGVLIHLWLGTWLWKDGSQAPTRAQ